MSQNHLVLPVCHHNGKNMRCVRCLGPRSSHWITVARASVRVRAAHMGRQSSEQQVAGARHGCCRRYMHKQDVSVLEPPRFAPRCCVQSILCCPSASHPGWNDPPAMHSPDCQSHQSQCAYTFCARLCLSVCVCVCLCVCMSVFVSELVSVRAVSIRFIGLCHSQINRQMIHCKI